VRADSLQKLFHNSLQISADMAHALHPNYSDRHKSNHRPSMNKGVVIKINHNQRYSTDAVSASLIKTIAERG
jgi:aspartyl aminopeptidase